MIKNMQVLEKILYDIEKEIMTKKTVWDSLEKPPYNDFEQSIWAAGMRNAKEIKMPKYIRNIFDKLNLVAGKSGMEVFGIKDKETGTIYWR